MRTRRLLAFLPAFAMLLIAGLTEAQTYINGQLSSSTTNATPIAVGTNTPVLLIPAVTARKCAWTMNWTEAGNLSCVPVAVGTTAGATTPSSTNGFLFASTKAPWSATQADDDPRLGWSCVSTA